MELTLDIETRDYFDVKFEKVQEKITENRLGVVKLGKELEDLKSNGYFVRPQRCEDLHSRVEARLRRLEIRLAGYVAVIGAALWLADKLKLFEKLS